MVKVSFDQNWKFKIQQIVPDEFTLASEFEVNQKMRLDLQEHLLHQFSQLFRKIGFLKIQFFNVSSSNAKLGGNNSSGGSNSSVGKPQASGGDVGDAKKPESAADDVDKRIKQHAVRAMEPLNFVFEFSKELDAQKKHHIYTLGSVLTSLYRTIYNSLEGLFSFGNNDREVQRWVSLVT